MLVVRAGSCKEGRYGIFLQLYTKVKAQPTWGSLSRSSALASADNRIPNVYKTKCEKNANMKQITDQRVSAKMFNHKNIDNVLI